MNSLCDFRRAHERKTLPSILQRGLNDPESIARQCEGVLLAGSDVDHFPYDRRPCIL